MYNKILLLISISIHRNINQYNFVPLIWFKDIKQDFSFPEPVELKIFIKDILEQDVEDKYYLSE